MMVVSTEAELEELLKKILIPRQTIVVGVGNELRCDDGFGTYLARSLSNILARYSREECVEVVDAGTAPESYLGVLNSKRVVVFLDAIEASAPPSEVIVLDKGEIPHYRTTLSTHSIGIDVLLSLLNSEVYVVGARPLCLDIRLGVTGAVARAMGKVIKAVIKVLGDYGCLETVSWYWDSRAPARAGTDRSTRSVHLVSTRGEDGGRLP